MFSLLFRVSPCFNLAPRAYKCSVRHFSITKQRQTQSADAIAVRHSRFIAEASRNAQWGSDTFVDEKDNGNGTDDMEGVTDTTGIISPTSSHLFKLILPLGTLSHPGSLRRTPSPNRSSNSIDSLDETNTTMRPPTPPPTIFLLHPSQPLSHVAKLISSSLSPASPVISFRSISSHGKAFQSSDSTDVGNFIRDSAKGSEFYIVLTYGDISSQNPVMERGESRYIPVDYKEDNVVKKELYPENGNGIERREIVETVLKVLVPTLSDRTKFLRRRLSGIKRKLGQMEALKNVCDEEAHRGAKHLAFGGFGVLVVYWGTVVRLTFWDLGWDVMEPVTYLSGLTMVVLSYLWFLYQGHEVSYSSVIDRSLSSRREALYKARGFDMEKWMSLINERRELYKEIGRIAEDYEDNSRKSKGAEDDEEVGEKIHREHERNGDGEDKEDSKTGA